ncbi:GNAT family N-acetyltransferase [Tropicibacter sp. S64]|uniref:GNAT family N-acetyltransferase n=1 Tax=Tropicibacter sp. S64 TaxID=3415122 RepID=UPI003C79E543
MEPVLNEYGQPIGPALTSRVPCPPPPHSVLQGRHVTLVPLVPEHAAGFLEAFTDPSGWTYLPRGPFTDLADAQAWTDAAAESKDPLYYTALVGGKPVGFLSYLRIALWSGRIEVGFIHLAPALQGTTAATEAQFLLMAHAFDDLGYRRYEWKCDSLNGPSRRAAERLGFTYEGTLRQAMHYKGRNRDTSWFSVLDGEWPAVKARFTAWLDPSNFDDAGNQKRRLQDC